MEESPRSPRTSYSEGAPLGVGWERFCSSNRAQCYTIQVQHNYQYTTIQLPQVEGVFGGDRLFRVVVVWGVCEWS